MNESNDEVLKIELAKAVSGLLYSSESDYPFEIIENVLPQQLLNAKEIEADHFFKNLTTEEDWFGKEEKAKAAQYTALYNLLKENLSELKVYKTGETDIEIYILGKSKSGTFMGLKTRSVET
ncbi:MAG TPA: nuclease A inhibitor family protein [Patescibacteria group bacterium]|nr:nuclease A inhibitor family protein [Patescibacteria group bacterium]